MKASRTLAAILLAGLVTIGHAQVPPAPAPDQLALLKSDDAKLARNKKHVFDFWRIVYEGGHVDHAPKYMAEEYIQHNPNLPSGRQVFVDYFRKARPAQPIADRIKMPVIAIVAEGDLVTVYTARKMRDPATGKVFTTTWFDMFRIDEDGLIAEHWDPSPMWVDNRPPGAEFFKEWDR